MSEIKPKSSLPGIPTPSAIQDTDTHMGSSDMARASSSSDQIAQDIILESPADVTLALTRHHEFWFSDGSVVLRAENTLFRVHISQLSRKSTFFRDLFSLSQPPAQADSPVPAASLPNAEMFEGCPLLVMHDSAEDLAHLLKALYDGPWFGNNDRQDFRMVSGILRLADKYVLDSLRKTAIAHLRVAWPLSLADWDAREDLARIYELETGMHRGFRFPSPVAVIHLAREVYVPELLPSAFYDLSRYHYPQIFEPGEDEPLGPASPTPTLCADDIQQLTLGKEASQHAVSGLIQGMMHASQPREHRNSMLACATSHYRRASSERVCVTPAACRKDFEELVALATQHYLFDRERGCADPLYVAEELGQLKSAEFSECHACARALEMWAARERERIWKQVPSWFRLGG